eukprot:1961845-Lingulodinium_polyedra.AAC.1
MAHCDKDRDPGEGPDGIFPHSENSWPMPGDKRFYEGNHWHPPVSPQQMQYDPESSSRPEAENVSTGMQTAS